MKKLALLPLVLANLGQAPAVKGGTVTGNVLVVVKGKAMKFDEPNEGRVAYVYLERTTPESLVVGRGVSAKIEQRNVDGVGRTFVPRITVVPRGAEVYFPNRDNEDHSVFSPPAKANNWYGFDLGSYKPNTVGKGKPFPDPGQFDIYCDVHKAMWAKVKVVPTRLFAKVVDGKFTLTDVPPGAYTIVAWAPDSNESRSARPVEIAAGATVTAETLKVQYTPKSVVHPRRDGSEYEGYDN